jgi:hypothetical protein
MSVKKKATQYLPYPFPLHCTGLTFHLATSAKIVRGWKEERKRVVDLTDPAFKAKL